MKIKITEKDLHYILKESIKYIKEAINEYGTKFSSRSFNGVFNIVDYVYDYAGVDNEIVEQFFAKYSFPRNIEYSVYETGGVCGAGPDDCGGDIVEDEESKARVQEISNTLTQIKPETPEEAKICQIIRNALNTLETFYSIDDLRSKLGGYFDNEIYDDQNDWEPDPDTMPGGHDYYE